MNKVELLEKVAKEIKICKVCLLGKSGKPVAGEGNPNAKIIFVGEAPGRQEAETGRPFVGRSGQLLTRLLLDIGVKREDVYITSPVKYYPGKRAPTLAEVSHGKSHLLKQIEIIQPKLVVLLGNVARGVLLDKAVSLASSHGQVIDKNHRLYFITFHPAAALRFKKIRNLMEQDFKKLKNVISQRHLI